MSCWKLVNDTAAAHAYGTYFGDGATVRMKTRWSPKSKRHIIGRGIRWRLRQSGVPAVQSGWDCWPKNGNAGNGHWVLLLSVDVR